MLTNTNHMNWQRLMKYLGKVCLLAFSLFLASCQGVYYGDYSRYLHGGGTQYVEGMGPANSNRNQGPPEDTESYWRGDGVPGAPGITISISQQKAYFYKGKQLVGLSLISSGDDQHHTPLGRYTITQKDATHMSSQYGDYIDAQRNILAQNIDRHLDPMPPGAFFDGARMPFFMRFTGGIGMHAGYLPGYPASHGCVRMPEKMARIFFANVNVGTPVEVRY